MSSGPKLMMAALAVLAGSGCSDPGVPITSDAGTGADAVDAGASTVDAGASADAAVALDANLDADASLQPSGPWGPIADAPPDGASVLFVVPGGSALYATTATALWVRGGNTPWRLAGPLPERGAVVLQPPLVEVGDTLWYNGRAAVWRSSDGGATWVEVARGLGNLTEHGAQLYAMSATDTVVWDDQVDDWRILATSEWASFEDDRHRMFATDAWLLRTANIGELFSELAVVGLDGGPWALATAPEVVSRGHNLVQDVGSDRGVWSYSFDAAFDVYRVLRTEDGVSWTALPEPPIAFDFAGDLSFARTTETFMTARSAGTPVYVLRGGAWQLVPTPELDVGAQLRRLSTWNGRLLLSDAYGVSTFDGVRWAAFDSGLYQSDAVGATDRG